MPPPCWLCPIEIARHQPLLLHRPTGPSVIREGPEVSSFSNAISSGRGLLRRRNGRVSLCGLIAVEVLALMLAFTA